MERQENMGKDGLLHCSVCGEPTQKILPFPLMDGNEGRCRSCGAKIRFVKMKSGKSMPVNEKIVNYKTDPHGKERIVTPGGDVVACVTGINADEATGFGYVSHFATCPNARNHRR